MPYSIPAELIIEKNKLDSSGLFLELIDITLSEAGTTLRLVNNNEDVVWNSNTWSRSNFQPGDFTESIDGGIETIDIRVSNLLEHSGKTIQRHIEDATIDNSLGDTVNYYLVNSENLDKGAAISINFEIQNISCNQEWCVFSLGMQNFYNNRFPLNTYRRNLCRWKVFGGPECRFALSSANTCDRRFITCLGFGHQLRFGGFPGIPKCGGTRVNSIGSGTPWIGGGGSGGGSGSGGGGFHVTDEVVPLLVTITDGVMTSADGVSWTSQTPASGNFWQDIAWGVSAAKFAVVSYTGTNDRVMTSTDGITWTARVTPVDNSWWSIAWASTPINLFAAVSLTGTANRAMTSPDGVNWTIRTTPVDNDWTSIAWSSLLQLYAAVSNTGTGDRVMTSPDGITWSSRTSANDVSWQKVIWASGIDLFVAVASTGTAAQQVMTSPNGTTWTARTSALAISWRSVAWSPTLSLLAAVGFTVTGNAVMTSSDGITWTINAAGGDNSWRDIMWSANVLNGVTDTSKGLFIAVASSGSTGLVMTSPDGITWTSQTAASALSWQAIAANE